MLNLTGAQSRDEQLRKHSLYASAMENWLEAFLYQWLGDVAIANKACA